MYLSVTMPYSRKDVLERLKKFSVTSSTLYSLLNTCFADWMINPVPVITGEELLQLCLECYGKRAYNPFMESLISRMTEGGEYTNYDKFFELLENHAEESWAFFAVAKVGYSLHKANIPFQDQLRWRSIFYKGAIPSDKQYDAEEPVSGLSREESFNASRTFGKAEQISGKTGCRVDDVMLINKKPELIRLFIYALSLSISA